MTDSYSTPSWIMALFGDWFDPCPLNDNPIIDGLSIDWYDRTFVNPPYSNPLPWIEKAIREREKGRTVALLLKLDCSTRWYRLLVEADAHFLYVGERVKFNGKSPPFANCLVILEDKK